MNKAVSKKAGYVECVLPTCQPGGGRNVGRGGLQVNTFEQVSSLGHQMSVLVGGNR